MVGHVPRALQLKVASRARTLYQALGQSRRVFSSLILRARHDYRGRQHEAAKSALGEARRLTRSEWPAEFHIHLLRRNSLNAREAGRSAEALALMREAARISAATRDWRLEVIDRTDLIDTMWLLGMVEEAAREACTPVGELRAKPAADADMSSAFANAIGCLSETGRIDEATCAARDALPIMRRAGSYTVEEWAYLVWRRGQREAAARLIGASDAQCIKDDAPRQLNEERLIARARADLEEAIGAAAFAASLAAGARRGEAELVALISEALAQAPGK